MKKLVAFSMLLCLGSGIQASAQSPIEKALKDPQRKSNEARADMKVIDSTSKSVISDSTAAKPVTKQAVQRKKKKARCCAVKNKKSA